MVGRIPEGFVRPLRIERLALNLFWGSIRQWSDESPEGLRPTTGLPGPLAQLHGLHFHYFAGLNAKAQQRSHHVEAIAASRAGVEVQ